MKTFAAFLCAFALTLVALPANAQMTAKAVSSCGSVTYDANTMQSATQDLTGGLCIGGSKAQGSTTSGQTGVLNMMATTTSPPTDTNAQTNPVRGDTHGGVRTVCQDTNGTVCDFTLPSIVISSSQYPYASTPIGGFSTGSTGAVVGTLAAAVGKTTYICKFTVSAIGGTAAVGPVVIAGLLSGSATYQFSSLAAGAQLGDTWTPCFPASATNTAITVTTTADGSASAVDVNVYGYQL